MTDTETVEHQNVHEAIEAIKAEIPMLSKDGNVEMGGKKIPILQIDDILKQIKPLFVKHRLNHYDTRTAKRTEYQLAYPAVNMKGEVVSDGRVASVRVCAEVDYDYRFVHVPTLTEVTVSFTGEAMDTQDKATRKATTSCWKICLIQTFDIITGEEDPDIAMPKETAPAEAKPDRGQQMAAKAKTMTPKDNPPEEQQPAAEKRSVTTNPRAALSKDEPEAVEAPAAVEVDKLDAIKARARVAIEGLGIERVKVDEIGKAITGQERAKWINSIPLAGKVATELERLLAEKNAPTNEPRGDEDPNAGDGL